MNLPEGQTVAVGNTREGVIKSVSIDRLGGVTRPSQTAGAGLVTDTGCHMYQNSCFTIHLFAFTDRKQWRNVSQSDDTRHATAT